MAKLGGMSDAAASRGPFPVIRLAVTALVAAAVVAPMLLLGGWDRLGLALCFSAAAALGATVLHWGRPAGGAPQSSTVAALAAGWLAATAYLLTASAAGVALSLVAIEVVAVVYAHPALERARAWWSGAGSTWTELAAVLTAAAAVPWLLAVTVARLVARAVHGASRRRS